MGYVDGVICAVANDRKAEYLAYAQKFGAVCKQFGATAVVECWGDIVPEGTLTSLPMAVKAEAGETVVFSWIYWPSKEIHEEGWAKLMQHPLMDSKANPMPFDGKRMIYGSFNVISHL
jgi:uncharacterized protein YbaA (DUF1428 family)